MTRATGFILARLGGGGGLNGYCTLWAFRGDFSDLRTDGSVVPPGLVGLGLLPLAGARGFILAPLRGEERESLK